MANFKFFNFIFDLFNSASFLTSHLSDSDETSTAEAESRWVGKNSPFMAHFLTHDFETDLRRHSDLVSELGRFHMVMATGSTLEKQMCRSSTDLMATLANISNLLIPGGFFVGMCFDSAEIWNHCIHSQFSHPSNPKPYFNTANNLIRIDFPKMAQFLALEEPMTHPAPQQTFSEWINGAPTLGIEFNVNMEQKNEKLFLVHSSTFVEAAKHVGLTCLSFRNLLEFYDTFKFREDDQLRKMQVFTKHCPKLQPEQKEATMLCSVFVFQKSS